MTVTQDKPATCPNCGNPAVGERKDLNSTAHYCITVTNPDHPEWGCGWLRVQRVE